MEGHVEIVKSENHSLYTGNGYNYKVQYHVRVRAANGKILVSSELYNRKRDALKCADLIRLIRRLRFVDETSD